MYLTCCHTDVKSFHTDAKKRLTRQDEVKYNYNIFALFLNTAIYKIIIKHVKKGWGGGYIQTLIIVPCTSIWI
jgi:hypothetical protein